MNKIVNLNPFTESNSSKLKNVTPYKDLFEKEGTDIFCGEYCQKFHSGMVQNVFNIIFDNQEIEYSNYGLTTLKKQGVNGLDLLTRLPGSYFTFGHASQLFDLLRFRIEMTQDFSGHLETILVNCLNQQDSDTHFRIVEMILSYLLRPSPNIGAFPSVLRILCSMTPTPQSRKILSQTVTIIVRDQDKLLHPKNQIQYGNLPFDGDKFFPMIAKIIETHGLLENVGELRALADLGYVGKMSSQYDEIMLKLGCRVNIGDPHVRKCLHCENKQAIVVCRDKIRLRRLKIFNSYLLQVNKKKEELRRKSSQNREEWEILLSMCNIMVSNNDSKLGEKNYQEGIRQRFEICKMLGYFQRCFHDHLLLNHSIHPCRFHLPSIDLFSQTEHNTIQLISAGGSRSNFTTNDFTMIQTDNSSPGEMKLPNTRGVMRHPPIVSQPPMRFRNVSFNGVMTLYNHMSVREVPGSFNEQIEVNSRMLSKNLQVQFEFPVFYITGGDQNEGDESVFSHSPKTSDSVNELPKFPTKISGIDICTKQRALYQLYELSTFFVQNQFLLFAGRKDFSVRVFDMRKKKIVRIYKSHPFRIRCIASKGSRVVFCCKWFIMLWDTSANRLKTVCGIKGTRQIQIFDDKIYLRHMYVVSELLINWETLEFVGNKVFVDTNNGHVEDHIGESIWNFELNEFFMITFSNFHSFSQKKEVFLVKVYDRLRYNLLRVIDFGVMLDTRRPRIIHMDLINPLFNTLKMIPLKFLPEMCNILLVGYGDKIIFMDLLSKDSISVWHEPQRLRIIHLEIYKLSKYDYRIFYLTAQTLKQLEITIKWSCPCGKPTPNNILDCDTCEECSCLFCSTQCRQKHGNGCVKSFLKKNKVDVAKEISFYCDRLVGMKRKREGENENVNNGNGIEIEQKFEPDLKKSKTE